MIRSLSRRLHLSLSPMLLLLVAALNVFIAVQPAAAARDPLARIEPPSPYTGKGWKDVQSEQISFTERLSQWGVTFEGTPNAKAVDDAARETKIEMKWTSENEVGMTIEVASPRTIGSYDFVGKYNMQILPTDIQQGVSGGIAFGEGKISGEIISATDTPLASQIAGEFKKGLATLKAATGTKGASYELSLDFGFSKVKVDPVKYFQRFVVFVPRFVDAARAPATAAAQELGAVNFNPGLIAAALTNNAMLWLRQMQTQKNALESAQKNLIDSFAGPMKQEVDFRKNQAAETEQMLQQIDQQEQEDARTATRVTSARAELDQKSRLTRPQAPPQPERIDSYAGRDSGSTGRSARQERDYSPPSRSMEVHSPTLDYLKGGNFGHGL